MNLKKSLARVLISSGLVVASAISAFSVGYYYLQNIDKSNYDNSAIGIIQCNIDETERRNNLLISESISAFFLVSTLTYLKYQQEMNRLNRNTE